MKRIRSRETRGFRSTIYMTKLCLAEFRLSVGGNKVHALRNSNESKFVLLKLALTIHADTHIQCNSPSPSPGTDLHDMGATMKAPESSLA